MKEKKLDKTICYLQEAQFKFKDTNSFKIKRIERDIPRKEQLYGAGMAIHSTRQNRS